ncbi:glycosyltransferase family protein [Humibacter ginsengisoli]
MRVVAVIVAHNRRELLLECLDALRIQSRPLDAIIVIDNASDDGSAAAAAAMPGVDVVRLEVNTGGAGGFAIGIRRAAYEQGADLAWVMDDDTVPSATALETLLAAFSSARERPGVLASRVVWSDGADHPMNTPRRKPLARSQERRDAAEINAVPIRSASFVSVLVDITAVLEHGLPVAEYFIWNDDFEFTARILRHRRGLFVPDSVVTHKTKARADTDADPGERFFFEVRNKLWLFRDSPALAWYETPLYLAATARRWLRTYLRSANRRTITRTFKNGWHDGMSKRPRPNHEYLASIGVQFAALTAGRNSSRKEHGA